MSFDVFVQCYGETEKLGLPRERVRALFPIVEEESGPDCWVVRYDDLNSSDIYVDAESEQFKGFMVNRPAGDIRFWQAQLTILRMGSVVMFWPGSRPLLAQKSDAEELPEDIVESLGEPVFVERAEEFLELLKAT